MNSASRRIRVLVADDSPVALRAVCEYLRFEGHFDIVGTANDGLSVIEQAEILRPDLAVLDLSMPRMSGLEAAERIRDLFPGMRLIVFSGLDDSVLEVECRERGVDGYVRKNRMPEELLDQVYELFPEDRKR
ncbi:MAG: response regulator transcription factor [Terriglobales bacterium]